MSTSSNGRSCRAEIDSLWRCDPRHSCGSETFRYHGAMINTVQAPCLSDQGRTITSSSANVLSITQPRPRARSVQLGPTSGG